MEHCLSSCLCLWWACQTECVLSTHSSRVWFPHCSLPASQCLAPRHQLSKHLKGSLESKLLSNSTANTVLQTTIIFLVNYCSSLLTAFSGSPQTPLQRVFKTASDVIKLPVNKSLPTWPPLFPWPPWPPFLPCSRHTGCHAIPQIHTAHSCLCCTLCLRHHNGRHLQPHSRPCRKLTFLGKPSPISLFKMTSPTPGLPMSPLLCISSSQFPISHEACTLICLLCRSPSYDVSPTVADTILFTAVSSAPGTAPVLWTGATEWVWVSQWGQKEVPPHLFRLLRMSTTDQRHPMFPQELLGSQGLPVHALFFSLLFSSPSPSLPTFLVSQLGKQSLPEKPKSCNKIRDAQTPYSL